MMLDSSALGAIDLQEPVLTYGKGRHPAALNFGDCLSYAMAVVSGEPLLCVGDDFRQTDCVLA